MRANNLLNLNYLIRICFALLIITFLPVPVFASSTFRDGVEAYGKGDYKTALPIFERLAELGHHNAQFNVGVMYLNGQGVEKDEAKAYAWFSLAAESGEQEWNDVRDKVFKIIPSSQKTKADNLEQILRKDYGQEALNMSLIPELTEPGIEYCKIEKTKWDDPVYPRTALLEGKQGWVDFAYTVTKYGDVKDFAIVESIPKGEFVRAAVKTIRTFKYDPPLVNDVNVEVHGVGQRIQYTLTGERTEAYAEKLHKYSVELLEKAESEDPVSQYAYGYVMATHPDLQMSNREAYEWYLKAAQGGFAPAQYAIGRGLMYGIGCEFDYSKSIEWLTKSAKSDYPYAQVLLGRNLLSLGNDMEKLKQGLFWLEKAADNDFVVAKMTLAWTYATHYDKTLHNPTKALELANSTYEDYYDQVTAYETLAAAYAANDEFKKAVKYQKKAFKKAKRLDWNLEDISNRLAAYKNGKPWYQPLDS